MTTWKPEGAVILPEAQAINVGRKVLENKTPMMVQLDSFWGDAPSLALADSDYIKFSQAHSGPGLSVLRCH